MSRNFNYAKEFKSLNLDAVIKDLHELMTPIPITPVPPNTILRVGSSTVFRNAGSGL
jgi:hypothetical protein